MNINDIPATFFVSLGAIIMVWNICGYLSFNRRMSELHSDSVNFPKRLFAVYLILLLFFLMGYIGIVVCLFCSIQLNSFLVGMILFFGSIFVFIALRLQFSMSSAIQKSDLEIIKVLVAAVEARDPNLNGHSTHVERLVRLLYAYIPKNCQHQYEIADLEYAALLHDIGKLGVSEAVLNKEGKLNEEEWEEIRKHPQIGKDILSRVEGLRKILDWILYHHERCDGKGYYGLSYEEIPYPSLMISVADTFSAITMDRSYREGKSYEQAVEILQECKGKQLDSDLVDSFLRISRDQIEEAKTDGGF